MINSISHYRPNKTLIVVYLIKIEPEILNLFGRFEKYHFHKLRSILDVRATPLLKNLYYLLQRLHNYVA